MLAFLLCNTSNCLALFRFFSAALNAFLLSTGENVSPCTMIEEDNDT